MKNHILKLIDNDISKIKTEINYYTMYNNLKFGPNHDKMIQALNTKLKQSTKNRKKATTP